MKMATGLEICDGESDMTAERSDEDKDPNTVEERFRVDRRKLEHMLQAGLDGTGESGERFFQKIMEQTETVITWPSKLKIGAKSKKDPHIKVAGLPISVKLAKDKIMLVLDTKSNRVTLKMDVSHTDHSHIIGKAGGNIKRVMQDTGCHIHFPDSNRGSQAEKSNQVSIAGQPLGVESARRQIRDLLPLVLTFELPIGGHVLPDPNSPPIIHIAQACNVSVSFKQRPRTGTQTVIVRGSQQHVAGLKDAIRRLVELFTGNVASTVQVSTQIDIAPQHHLFIIGKNGTNIKQIMQTTGARIGFPEANCPQRKGTVFITSSVQSVLDARAQLMDCLPLVLMFDLREEDRELSADAEDLNKLMEEFDVFLSVKHKPKQASKSVIVKSCERNAKNMYLARQAILGLDRNENQAVPPPFTRSDFPPCSPINMDEYYGLLAFQTSPINGHCPSPLPSPVATSMTSVTAWLPTNVTPASPTISSLMGGAILPPTNQLLSCPSSPLIGCGSTPPPPPPGLGPPNPDFCASHVMSQYATPSQGSCEQSNGTESPINSPLGQRTSNSVSQRLPSPIGTIGQRTCSPGLERQMSSGSSIRLGSSGSSSPRSPRSKSPPLFQDEGGLLGSESSNDLMDSLLANREARSTSFGSGGSTGSLGICQTSRRPVEILSGTKNAKLHSSTTSVATDSTDSDSLNSSLSLLDNLLVQKSNLSQDYEQKKEMASKAMKKRVVFSEVRTPTNQWSGLGFSKSMPESAIKELLSSKAKAKGGMLPYNPPFQNSAFQPCTTSFSSMANTTAVRDTRCHSMYEVSPQSRLDAESSECQYGTYSEHLSNRRESVSLENCADLQELFEKLKLTKYWDTFKGEEVDLPTFMTLTEEDLKELGVSAFGARRKMLNAIRVLQFFQEKEPSSKNIEPSSTLPDVAYNPLPFPRRRIDSASQSGRW